MAGSPFSATAPSLVLSDVFVAEHYLAGADRRRAESLTRLLRASNGHLRYALFLPADETYFAVYDGTSLEAVRAATAVRAPSGSPLDRIVRAVLLDPVSVEVMGSRRTAPDVGGSGSRQTEDEEEM